MDMISSKPVNEIKEVNNGNNSIINSTDKNDTKVRNVRALPAFLGAGFLPGVGKAVGYGLSMAAAGMTISGFNHFMDDYYLEKRAKQKITRRRIDCAENNFGCAQNLCWTNCGPRIDYADWCFTTTNITSKVIQFIKCETDADCSPCLPCAGVCMFDVDISDYYSFLTSKNFTVGKIIPTTTV